jgi:hypothetical protein
MLFLLKDVSYELIVAIVEPGNDDVKPFLGAPASVELQFKIEPALLLVGDRLQAHFLADLSRVKELRTILGSRDDSTVDCFTQSVKV